MKEPVDFVYPWVQGEDKFEELRYSLRSLEKHYKEPFRVVIVGDMPGWCQNVEYIKADRKKPPEIDYENITYDALWKMHKVCESNMVSGVFIRMYDDIFLLKDMGFKEISELKALYLMDKNSLGDKTSSDNWRKQLINTMEELRLKGHSTWNFETHLPEVFLKSVMSWVLQEFDALNKRLLMTSLYCNVCWQPGDDEPSLVTVETNYKAGFYGVQSNYSYGARTYPEIKKIIRGKQFLNFNDNGLSPHMIKIVEEMFPNKSKFEK